MHLFNCEHPKKVFNRYTNEWLMVPCGKCDICRSKRSYRWSDRLERERSCHPYCLFGTLTYSEKFLPKFFLHDDGFVNHATGEEVLLNDLKFYDEDSINYVKARGFLPVCDVKDAQAFIKRLRERVRNNPSGESKSDRYIRYFLVSEYGATMFRPHYHFIIYSSSKWLADNAKSVVSSCWSTDGRYSDSEKLGIIDCQNVRNGAPSYVSSYLNCSTDLPKIYNYKRFRPFSIFSKSPALGSLLSDDAQVKALFDSGSTTLRLYKQGSNEFSDVPIPSDLCNRLYPKIRGFNQLSYELARSIYKFGFNSVWFGFSVFEEFVRQRVFGYSDCTARYLEKVLDDSLHQPNKSCLKDLYSKLFRFSFQSIKFGFSIDTYFDKIYNFYKSLDYDRLKSQYEFIEGLDGESVSFLSDILTVSRLKSVSSSNLSDSDRMILFSYGWDESTSHIDFLEKFDFSKCSDFLDYRSMCSKVINDHLHKRSCNDYLEHRKNENFIFLNYLKLKHGLSKNYEGVG